ARPAPRAADGGASARGARTQLRAALDRAADLRAVLLQLLRQAQPRVALGRAARGDLRLVLLGLRRPGLALALLGGAPRVDGHGGLGAGPRRRTLAAAGAALAGAPRARPPRDLLRHAPGEHLLGDSVVRVPGLLGSRSAARVLGRAAG